MTYSVRRRTKQAELSQISISTFLDRSDTANLQAVDKKSFALALTITL